MELVQWFRQLALLLQQGVHILAALECLQAQAPEGALRTATYDLIKGLTEGQRLSVAFKRQGKIFPPVVAVLMEVSERTGSLVVVLHRLADSLERDLQVRGKTLQALTYPLVVLGVTGLLLIILLRVVVPSFRSILLEMHCPLPALTQWILGASHLLGDPLGLLACLVVLGGTFWTLRSYAKTPTGRKQIFQGVSRLPLAGRLLACDCMVRYCDVLGLTTEAGVDPRMAHRLAAAASLNPILAEDALPLCEAMRDGELASEYMHSQPDIYPRTLVVLLRSAEESGLQVRFLAVARQHYQLELEALRQALLAALEPILLVLVALVVGAVVLALLLPLQASLTQMLG